MHTKKTNNTNKLIQISYHSALTKIQKLQNLKKKKKKLFSVPAGTPDTGWYCPKLASMTGTWLVWPVFKPVRNVDVSISVYILVLYILAGTVGTDTVLTTLPYTSYIVNCSSFMAREHLYFRHEAP